MTDERMQQLLDDARATYRVPAEPPLEAMWARIEREHFDLREGAPPMVDGTDATPMRPARRRWLTPFLATAATLVIGVGIGRVTAPTLDAPEAPTVADATERISNPLQRTTYEYLDETVALLASLPRDGQANDAQFVTRAARLLATTRLLLDSPAASEPRLRDLLEDLELVLAQAARLRTQPRAEELTFIAEAMDERDVVPRLRTVAAALSTSDY